MKAIALAFAALLAAGCIVPFLSDESRAIDDSDYMISIPGYVQGSPVHLKLANGETQVCEVYITNLCEDVLQFKLTGDFLTDDISFGNLESVHVPPADEDTKMSYILLDLEISAAEIMQSCSDVSGMLNIRVWDTRDNTIAAVTIPFLVSVVSDMDTTASYNKFFERIDNTLPQPLDSPIIPFIVTFLVYLALCVLAVKLMSLQLARLSKNRTLSTDNKKVVTLCYTAQIVFQIGLFMNQGLKIIGADIHLIYWAMRINDSLMAIVAILLIWIAYIRLVDFWLARSEKKKNSSIDNSLFPLFNVFGKIVLGVSCATYILRLFDINLTGILISAGIITLGITFGAQTVLQQFFSGISLMLSRPFGRGDYIVLDGETYVVRRVKIMYTELSGIDWDRVITMPNNIISGQTIINMTKYDRFYRMKIGFQVPYGEDIKRVEEVLLKMAQENEHVVHNHAKYQQPQVKLIDFQDSGIDMRLDVTVADYRNLPTVQSDMKKALYRQLEEAHIDMPYNRIDVSIVGDDAQSGTQADPQ